MHIKIFSGIINKRLYDWAEDNAKTNESQAGFRKGYSAVKLQLSFNSK
jgi:hypothetical protein